METRYAGSTIFALMASLLLSGCNTGNGSSGDGRDRDQVADRP